MTNTTNEHLTPEPERRSAMLRVLPVAWLALSVAWVTVILVTDQVAWPLALWVATTLVPVTAIERRRCGDEPTDASGAPT